MYQTKNGYWRMGIKINGTWEKIYLHRYVWELYNGPIPEGYDVHHKNGNRSCNCIVNLELIEHRKHLRMHKANVCQETRDKMSKSKIGGTLSEYHKINISNSLIGNQNGHGYKQTIDEIERKKVIQRTYGLRKSNTSKYRGVTFDKSRGKWVSQISTCDRHLFLGRFDSPEEAARAYDTKARELWGDIAYQNMK